MLRTRWDGAIVCLATKTEINTDAVAFGAGPDGSIAVFVLCGHGCAREQQKVDGGGVALEQGGHDGTIALQAQRYYRRGARTSRNVVGGE